MCSVRAAVGLVAVEELGVIMGPLSSSLEGKESYAASLLVVKLQLRPTACGLSVFCCNNFLFRGLLLCIRSHLPIFSRSAVSAERVSCTSTFTKLPSS